jgi:RimJ/RimL family protein N-acetyltransferase
VAWGLLREAWGHGYATEGSVAAIDWAFGHLGWSEVIHTIAPDNLASQQVARRLGSTRRGAGRLPEPFQDVAVDVWGQSREAWMRRRA